MTPSWKKFVRLEVFLLVLAISYPLFGLLEGLFFQVTGIPLGIGKQLTFIFIYSILALGLNVVVGYTGLLHLGIAAFFGIGAYITGIFTIPGYPFQWGFIPALVLSALGAAGLGVLLGAPTLRLRGDYLAIVTLGFGEVVRFSLRNLEEITAGTRGLNPIPAPSVPRWIAAPIERAGGSPDDVWLFFITLALLLAVVVMLRNLEKSRIGRSWIAIREDELAATCMGIRAARVKLSAFALGCGLAGAAGCLYATTLHSTADPNVYDFNRSVIMLCCIILGGLASLRGTIIGVIILVGFDNVLSPILDTLIQNANINSSGSILLTFSGWRLMIFGLALILMMRYRPEGLLPSQHIQDELHRPKRPQPALGPGAR